MFSVILMRGPGIDSWAPSRFPFAPCHVNRCSWRAVAAGRPLPGCCLLRTYEAVRICRPDGVEVAGQLALTPQTVVDFDVASGIRRQSLPPPRPGVTISGCHGPRWLSGKSAYGVRDAGTLKKAADSIFVDDDEIVAGFFTRCSIKGLGETTADASGLPRC